MLSITRFLGTRRTLHQLVYEKYDNPLEVLSLRPVPAQQTSNEAEIDIVMAPINPADINTIQGVYPIKPPLPAVPGGECVGKIASGKSFNKGDRVIVLKLGWGTWKEYGAIEEKYLYKVPEQLSDAAAATLSVNPCTAYRMLKDYVNLEKGDAVIQNGANSAVGQFVIQLCNVWGIKTINIVRNRENIAELKTYLSGLGADVVLTEEELSKGLKKLDLKVPLPRLALNCVGGRSATELCRNLAHKGTLVTYGGMSKQPVIMPTAQFIFNDIRCHGFWMSRWKEENEGKPNVKPMLDFLCDMMVIGKLKQPSSKVYPLSSWREAIGRAMEGFTNEKIILSMR